MTTVNITLLVILALVALSFFWDWRQSGRMLCVPIPRPYRDQDSQEAMWRRRHGERMNEVDAVLTLVCDAFSFNTDDRFKFGPDDRIVDIYRACYPRWKIWRVADVMEIESLMLDLDKQFGIDIADRLDDISLGQVVERATQNGRINEKALTLIRNKDHEKDDLGHALADCV